MTTASPIKDRGQLIKDVEAILRGEPVEGYAAGFIDCCMPFGYGVSTLGGAVILGALTKPPSVIKEGNPK